MKDFLFEEQGWLGNYLALSEEARPYPTILAQTL